MESFFDHEKIIRLISTAGNLNELESAFLGISVNLTFAKDLFLP